jgi:hypothetical protein
MWGGTKILYSLDRRPQRVQVAFSCYFCWGGGGGGDVTRVDRVKGGGGVLCSASWAANAIIMTVCKHESGYRKSMFSLLSVSMNVTVYSSLCECTFMFLVSQQKLAVPPKL